MGRPSISQPAELYACLYAKEFPAQALLRLRPDLHSEPCVVMEGEVPTQHVCSLNTKARLLGMERGMIAIAREHDCSGHWQAVADANRLKKALNRSKLIPGLWGVLSLPIWLSK